MLKITHKGHCSYCSKKSVYHHVECCSCQVLHDDRDSTHSGKKGQGLFFTHEDGLPLDHVSESDEEGGRVGVALLVLRMAEFFCYHDVELWDCGDESFDSSSIEDGLQEAVINILDCNFVEAANVVLSGLLLGDLQAKNPHCEASG